MTGSAGDGDSLVSPSGLSDLSVQRIACLEHPI